MSFGFQGPSEIPMIQSAQHMMNNGGGGNLGYMQGRQKKKKDEEKMIFSEDAEDSFVLSEDLKSNEEPQKEEKSFSNGLKSFISKITGKINQVNPQ